ncbi:MAG: aminoglycoside phosphotransferase family protein [Acidimicrobiia bacterium]|nr:aminoglycoside phosphotransferase family protein [Acidimicrobiia bacterium]
MHRIGLDVVPAPVRLAIEEGLGAPIVEWANRPAGYGPSLAAGCTLGDGRRAFVKAVSTAQNPDSPDMLRRELVVGRALRAEIAAPPLLFGHDDGEWVAGGWELIDGHQPGAPWTAADLRALFDALATLAAQLDPNPVPGLPRWADHCPRGWAELAADPPATGLDGWTRRHLARLAAVEAGWAEAVAGDALLHNDVRSDNVVIDRAGAVWFTDWANAQQGAAWLDVVSMFPAVALEGGPEPEDALALAGRLHGDPDPEAVTTYLVALAGYFTHCSLLPSPPGLPTVRAFQAAQGEVARRWVAARAGLA